MLDKNTFLNVPNIFRGVPFWSLNDQLEKKEIIRQIHLMEKGGLGGFFLHAREGLITPYLSDEWMEIIRIAAEEARKIGMYAWLYDEDRWPSGFAGGIVPAMKEEYRPMALMLTMYERLDKVEDALIIFKGTLERNNILDLEVVKETEKTEKGKIYLYFVKVKAPLGQTWFSNFSYIDTLNPKAVSTFIKVTYEKYFKYLKEFFGDSIPGIFTDEPNISANSFPTINFNRGPKYPPAFLPWTENLPKLFKVTYGYDLLENLPSLFFDVGDYTKVRYDFWKLITKLFVESFSKQIYEWCSKHNLKFTGHYLYEDNLLGQLIHAGAVMPHYEYEHVPGIDHLGRNIDRHLTVKQVASAANQLGKQRVLCEAYGASGQNLSFEDRKWIGDWLYVLGVNLLNHHLELYTMRGKRKRDYPPNLFWQQPWWKYNRLIEDYFARLSYILSQGERIANILLLHPIGSAWALYTPLNTSKVKELDKKFLWLTKELLNLKLDYELGDEMLIEKYGKVEGKTFIIGRSKYSVVIIPPSVTLSKRTIELLEEFIENGGEVIAFEPLPYLTDGRQDERLEKILSKVHVIKLDKKDLLSTLRRFQDYILIENDHGEIIEPLWYHLRKINDVFALFIVNTNNKEGYKAKIKIKEHCYVEEWNPITGKINSIYPEKEGKYMIIENYFSPSGSILLVFYPDKRPLLKGEIPKYSLEKEVEFSDEWNYEFEGYNSLLLDYCKADIEGIYDIDKNQRIPVLKAHELAKRAGYGNKISLKFEFNVSFKKQTDKKIFLVMETPEKFEIILNGEKLEYNKDEYWIDTSFKMIKIDDKIKNGTNEIILRGIFDFDIELENIYIVGNFAVKNIDNKEFVIVDLPELLKSGDFVYQGFPFFAGSIILKNNLKIEEKTDKVILSIEGLNSIVTEVKVNDKIVGYIFLHPHEIDITDFIKIGLNSIELKLVNSLRNLLGPHHHKAGELFAVGPGSFLDENNWTDSYNFVPFGLKKVTINFYRKI